jgi:hypothetical protein
MAINPVSGGGQKPPDKTTKPADNLALHAGLPLGVGTLLGGTVAYAQHQANRFDITEKVLESGSKEQRISSVGRRGDKEARNVYTETTTNGKRRFVGKDQFSPMLDAFNYQVEDGNVTAVQISNEKSTAQFTAHNSSVDIYETNTEDPAQKTFKKMYIASDANESGNVTLLSGHLDQAGEKKWITYGGDNLNAERVFDELGKALHKHHNLDIQKIDTSGLPKSLEKGQKISLANLFIENSERLKGLPKTFEQATEFLAKRQKNAMLLWGGLNLLAGTALTFAGLQLFQNKTLIIGGGVVSNEEISS